MLPGLHEVVHGIRLGTGIHERDRRGQDRAALVEQRPQEKLIRLVPRGLQAGVVPDDFVIEEPCFLARSESHLLDLEAVHLEVDCGNDYGGIFRNGRLVKFRARRQRIRVEQVGLALEHKPDAVLLDLMMPKFSGGIRRPGSNGAWGRWSLI